MKAFVLPSRILMQSGEKCKNLFKKQTLQIGLREPLTTTFSTGESVVLDFGKQMCGGVRILTFKANSTRVRIRFGESLSEASSEIGGKTNATNDHSPRDFEVTLQSYSDLTFGQTGFRFVRIDFCGEAVIKSIIAANEIMNRRPIYRYGGNDARIKDIFDAAKRTLDLCCSSGYVWDGVKRDRLVWIGDMSPEVLGLTTLYGALPCIERSLSFGKEQAPIPAWMNGMPAYSMWWIIILADYLERTGRIEFAKRQLGYLKQLIDLMAECIKENGELSYPSYFVDWPTHGEEDELAGVRAINVLALKRAIYILEFFGEDTSLANELKSRLLKIEINAKKKQVLALKHFATGLTESDKARLVEGGARGMSTFMSYYILKAVASFDKPRAIEMMKEYYGAMLDKGATTFWEDFDIDWCRGSSRIDELPKDGEADIHGDFGAFCYKGFRHSLCHGWSAGVISFIKEEIE